MFQLPVQYGICVVVDGAIVAASVSLSAIAVDDSIKVVGVVGLIRSGGILQ